jgi:hypothetical protein
VKKNKRELGELRRDLKACKAKIESQTKQVCLSIHSQPFDLPSSIIFVFQVQDYSERLTEYDNKFDETSKKFQTLLTVYNSNLKLKHFSRYDQNIPVPCQLTGIE